MIKKQRMPTSERRSTLIFPFRNWQFPYQGVEKIVPNENSSGANLRSNLTNEHANFEIANDASRRFRYKAIEPGATMCIDL